MAEGKIDGRQTREGAETNESVGRRLGLSHSGVSRIRNGERYPSLPVMRKIRDVYGWPIAEQLTLIPDKGRNMAYADALEQRIAAAV